MLKYTVTKQGLIARADEQGRAIELVTGNVQHMQTLCWLANTLLDLRSIARDRRDSHTPSESSAVNHAPAASCGGPY